jgi:hypothetical protein
MPKGDDRTPTVAGRSKEIVGQVRLIVHRQLCNDAMSIHI